MNSNPSKTARPLGRLTPRPMRGIIVFTGFYSKSFASFEAGIKMPFLMRRRTRRFW